MKTILAFVFVLFSACLSLAQLTPPSAVVNSVQTDGSGCEANSANAVMTPDLNYISVLYDRFIAEIGKGTANPNAKAIEKQCTIWVNVNVPQGWTFDIDSIEYRGYVEVPNKLTAAYQLATAEISGAGKSFGFEQALVNGPRAQNYSLVMKNTTPVKLSTMACNSGEQNIRVRIKSVIGVRNLLASITKPAVRVVVDSTDVTTRQNLKLNWRRCN